MQLLIDNNRLQLLLEQKKKYIGKKVTLDSVLSSTSLLISVILASYHDYLGISGNVFKTIFVLIGFFFTGKSIYDIFKDTKEKYDYSDLLQDINKLNEITHNHSIIIIKDTFNAYPNRFLVYEDERWNCEHS